MGLFRIFIHPYGPGYLRDLLVIASLLKTPNGSDIDEGHECLFSFFNAGGVLAACPKITER